VHGEQLSQPKGKRKQTELCFTNIVPSVLASDRQSPAFEETEAGTTSGAPKGAVQIFPSSASPDGSTIASHLR
jgi:hypothetical protein